MVTEIISYKHSVDELHHAARYYQHQNRKIMNGCVLYEPRLQVPLIWHEDTLYQVCELFACSTRESYAVLQLLSTTSTSLTIGEHTFWKWEKYLDEDDDEIAVRVPHSCHRYLLSAHGIEKLLVLLYRNTTKYVGVPTTCTPCTAEEALRKSLLTPGRTLKQVRFMLLLNIHYLVQFANA